MKVFDRHYLEILPRTIAVAPKASNIKIIPELIQPLSHHDPDTMTRFRPCIDLHAGQVKQIVGGTLTTNNSDLKTNYVSTHSASYYAELYKSANSFGPHVIMLGPGNDDAAREALTAWPGMLQVGGGINDKNAKEWIESGAGKVIITSFLFPDGKFSQARLDLVLESLNNDKGKLVIDLSCRRKGDTWYVAMNKWQTITSFEITEGELPLAIHPSDCLNTTSCDDAN